VSYFSSEKRPRAVICKEEGRSNLVRRRRITWVNLRRMMKAGTLEMAKDSSKAMGTPAAHP
jgi:hypothetical protein